MKGEFSNRLFESTWATKVQQRIQGYSCKFSSANIHLFLDSLKNKYSQTNISIDQLVAENMAYAQGTPLGASIVKILFLIECVPESLKAEFMHKINENVNKVL